jgi:DNA-binding HxlR family transcriptional regulator
MIESMTENGLHLCDASVTLAFSILGKRWNGMILSTLGRGALSFAALLSELAEASLIARTVEPGPPVAVSYALTSSGERLLPILDQLGAWAYENLSGETSATAS